MCVDLILASIKLGNLNLSRHIPVRESCDFLLKFGQYLELD